MSDDELDRIWRRRILPGTETMAVPCAEPVTVFLGGQPAAGKSARRGASSICTAGA